MRERENVIFYDVDGTLALPFESPPVRLRKLLHSLDRAGVRQVLCSGKNKEYLAGLARGLGLSNCAEVIAENGGVIFDWKKQIVHKVAEREKKKVRAIYSSVMSEVNDLEIYEEPKETIITIFVKDLEQTQGLAERIKMAIPEGFAVKHYQDGAIDIFCGDIHKGKAVKSYLEMFSPEANVFTCGDGHNDLEMLSVGVPLSFASAHPEVVKLVKKRGGIVADKNGPDGILQALSRLIFSCDLPVINDVDFIYRDWGSWEVLSGGQDYKVKKMVVNAGASLSLQKHQHRSEHWFVFDGKAGITLNNKEIELTAGEDFYIPVGGIHSIKNIGDSDLVIIEVQRGSYLGEDDIIRFN